VGSDVDMSAVASKRELERRRAAKRAARDPPPARRVELIDGERIEGVVIRLPMWNAVSGTWLFLATASETVCIPASASKGHSVLTKLLSEQNVAVDDHVTVSYLGKQRTRDGEREYRDYRLEVRR
jgi:hypothetical protein